MRESFYVGIGASAGGLEALEKFVTFLPLNSGNVYIIAQHSLSDKKSLLADILARYTSLSVTELTSETLFLNDHIYVIPAGYNLIFKKHTLILEAIKNTPHHASPSVDILFESLAAYKKKNAVAVLLSGSGHDGVEGMKKIKAYGGITIAQLPEEALYNGMPKSAIDAGVVDHVCSIDEIFYHFNNPSLNALESIQNSLQTHEKIDLRQYKKETVLRRIKKRMMLLHLKTIEAYAQYLTNTSEEAHLLYQDILIGVTAFFRDPEAYEALERSLRKILAKREAHSEFRVWCVACATGEEAYSLGILITEISKQLAKVFDVRIFATDIDDDSLNKARIAEYPKESFSKMDKRLIETYFTPINNGYKVNQCIRQNIVFTHHNILQDPPFINQDFISCRNLLIYILPITQKEIFALFHYSLKSEGILFLGSSESTLLSLNYFTPLDSQYKIYEKEMLQNPPKISNHYFSKHLEQKPEKTVVNISDVETRTIEERITNAIFDFFAPHCVIVDRNFTMVYKKGDIPALRFSDGIPCLNLFHNLDPSLRYDMKSLLNRAFSSGLPESTKFIEISPSGTERLFIRGIAYPFEDLHNTPMLLIYFQELKSNELQFNSGSLYLADESMVLKNLTGQLASAREEIRTISDELTISKETTQLMNEELQSSNEELQSSNEELHVSLAHIERLQQHLSLIFNSSFDGIMGLDKNGRHTFVNTAATEMLGYTKDEMIGKDSHTLWHHTKPDGTPYPNEECTTKKLLSNGVSRREENLFWRKDGSSFDVELLQSPIIEEGEITGAVISFHDITEKKRLEKIASHEHQLSELYLNISGILMMTLDKDGTIMMINREGCKILGRPHEDLIGKNFIGSFIPNEFRDEIHSLFTSILSGNSLFPAHHTNILIDANGQSHQMSWANAILKDNDGNITGVITSGMDISNEERLTQELKQSERLYELTFQEADVGIAHLGLDGIWIDVNNYLCTLLDYTKEEFNHLNLLALTYSEDASLGQNLFKEILENKRHSYRFEKRLVRKNGSIVWVNIAIVLLRDERGAPLHFLAVIRDISEIKLLMLDLETQKMQFQYVIEFAPIPIMLHDEGGEIVLTNHAMKESTGYLQNEISDMEEWMSLLYPTQESASKKEFQKSYNFPHENALKEHIITTKTGEKRVWIVTSVLLNLLHNGKKLIVSSAIDITEVQRKDEIMISQSRQAAMGDMLAMIAHQWRQPLSIITMSANTLKAHLELEEEITTPLLENFIETVNKQAHYLSNTIDDFKDFFKPDKLKEKTTVAAILEKLVTLVQKGLENNSITLKLPDNSNIEIFLYPNQLLQAMINIINNAKDAIKEHRLTDGIICIKLHQKDEEIIIEICDNGGGIDPSIQKNLAEPYITTKASNGTGLGLYMSKVIITKHLGGRLWWSSDSIGSCFYIALPLKNS